MSAQRPSPSRQGKEKSGALALLADAPDSPAVPLNDPLHSGQADAGSGVLFDIMQPFERDEEIGSVLHIETDAVIPDIEGRIPILLQPAELDPRFCHVSGVLPRVFQ